MQDKPSLNSQSNALRETYREPIAQELKKIEQCLETGFNPLRKGDKLPDFLVEDFDGNTWKLANLLKKGILVISFNRGNLCAFCQMEVNTWKSYLDDLKFYGATFITLSADKTWSSNHSVSGIKDNFMILHDKDFKVAHQFGLVYQLNPGYLNIFESFGIQLDDFFGEKIQPEIHSLPVPATYIISTNGMVLYDFIEPDFTQRAEPFEVLKVIIEHLKK